MDIVFHGLYVRIFLTVHCRLFFTEGR
jgi:hypothetical protein